jgi:hypothetical protein
LKYNLNKFKIIVFRIGGKLKATEGQRVNRQNIEVVDKCTYLGVTLESTGSWNKQKTLARDKGYRALVAINKCISVTPNTEIQMLRNIQVTNLQRWNLIDRVEEATAYDRF